MSRNHYQQEETYLFSSTVAHLRKLSLAKPSLTTISLLATFYRLYDEKDLFKLLLEGLENEIKTFNSDPTRESNRIKKVFACSVYKAIAKKPKHKKILENYIKYAMNSKDWLGQPRIACCITFLKDDSVSKKAKNYLKDNFSAWLSDERDDFISVALVGLGKDVSIGNLQKTIEHVESRINNLSLNTSSLYLIGISQAQSLQTKNEIEDRLYQIIKKKLTGTSITSLEDEGIIYGGTAILIAKYYRISGYYEKYASELEETLALKDYFSSVTKKEKARNRFLCITLIIAIGLLCLMFYLPTIVAFEKNPSTFCKIILTINSQKGWALGTSLVLIAYILVSYFKTGDPVLGLIEWIKEKLPGLLKENKRG